MSSGDDTGHEDLLAALLTKLAEQNKKLAEQDEGRPPKVRWALDDGGQNERMFDEHEVRIGIKIEKH